MGRTDKDEGNAFPRALEAALRSGSAITRTTWSETAPTMTMAAWEALSDPDAPLLGDDLPDLDAEDGSTLWTVGVERLSTDYGPGLTAHIDVPAFGSGDPFRLTLSEHGVAMAEVPADDTLDAMRRADELAKGLGWQLGQAPRGTSSAVSSREA